MNARYLYPGNRGNLENQQEAEWKVPQVLLENLGSLEYSFPVFPYQSQPIMLVFGYFVVMFFSHKNSQTQAMNYQRMQWDASPTRSGKWMFTEIS